MGSCVGINNGLLQNIVIYKMLSVLFKVDKYFLL